MSNITEEEQKRLSGFYFYIQDVTHEISITIQNLIANKNKTPKGLSKQDSLIFYASMRMALNTIALGICKISEALEAKGVNKLLNELSINSAQDLIKFKKKYYSKEIKEYRNTYAVHPLNKNDEFPSYLDIADTLQKALRIKSCDDGNLSITSILDSLEYIHGKHSDSGLINIVRKLGIELQKKINITRV